MEKLFLVCLNGICFGILEEGHSPFQFILSCFAQESDKKQKEFIKDSFQEALTKCKNVYQITFVTTDSEKEDLKKAIGKIIDYKKENSNDGWRTWEEYLKFIDYKKFDEYNKEIVSIL